VRSNPNPPPLPLLSLSCGGDRAMDSLTWGDDTRAEERGGITIRAATATATATATGPRPIDPGAGRGSQATEPLYQ
jgi:hypothetical protein